MKKRVLVVAPHPDDETLGAGGTIAKFVQQGHEVSVLVVSGHLPPIYSRADYDVTITEAARAFSILGITKSRFLEIPATMVGEQPAGVLNGEVAGMIKEIKPQIVLCPFPDRHIDHRAVFESVMVATRPVAAGCGIEVLAAYETLSETHWNAPHMEPNFVPNWVVDISAQIDRKIEALTYYESQIPSFPGARSLEAVKALAIFRGTQAGFPFGEGFQIIRMIG
ncbi:MAG: PIG-L deacetylase family protein [Sulfuritalea sp.]|nr:PIG-L deacetylase family protein [Sulfuritalea sp.]